MYGAPNAWTRGFMDRQRQAIRDRAYETRATETQSLANVRARDQLATAQRRSAIAQQQAAAQAAARQQLANSVQAAAQPITNHLGRLAGNMPPPAQPPQSMPLAQVNPFMGQPVPPPQPIPPPVLPQVGPRSLYTGPAIDAAAQPQPLLQNPNPFLAQPGQIPQPLPLPPPYQPETVSTGLYPQMPSGATLTKSVKKRRKAVAQSTPRPIYLD